MAHRHRRELTALPLLVLTAAQCVPGARPGTLAPPRPAVLARPASVSPVAAVPPPARAVQPVDSARPAPPPIVPAVSAALAVVTRDAFDRDVRVLAVPRHARSAPVGLRAAAGYIARELGRAGFTVTRQRVSHGGASVDNVIGELAGASDPARVVIAVAHYDAVSGSPGADDNASGVAGTLAVARAVAALRPPATVRVIAFAFEEDGLVGSLAYAGSLAASERARVAAVLNLEMIAFATTAPRSQSWPAGLGLLTGRRALPTTGDFIGALGLREADAPMQALRDARVYVPGLRVELVSVPRALLVLAPDLLRSDHAAFWLHGMPAVMVGDTAEYRNPNYHHSSDAVATLDLDFAAQVAQWAAAGVLLLAGAR